MSCIHDDFVATGLSAVHVSKDILVGRPYGGAAILFRKKFASVVKLLNTSDPCICAITVSTNLGPLMTVCVYMPSNTGDIDSFECFMDTFSQIIALYNESDTVNLVITGDFNCQAGSKWFDTLYQLTDDNELMRFPPSHNVT